MPALMNKRWLFLEVDIRLELYCFVWSGVAVPHVVLNGNVMVEDVFSKFESLFIRDGSRILRTLDVFLERGGVGLFWLARAAF